MEKITGLLNAKLRDPKYRKQFEKAYKEFSEIVDSWRRLVEAGDDLVDSFRKYGGKWDGMSLHMRSAVDRWVAVCGEEVTNMPIAEIALPIGKKTRLK